MTGQNVRTRPGPVIDSVKTCFRLGTFTNGNCRLAGCNLSLQARFGQVRLVGQALNTQRVPGALVSGNCAVHGGVCTIPIVW
jgi:hypothetical protein